MLLPSGKLSQLFIGDSLPGGIIMGKPWLWAGMNRKAQEAQSQVPADMPQGPAHWVAHRPGQFPILQFHLKFLEMCMACFCEKH